MTYFGRVGGICEGEGMIRVRVGYVCLADGFSSGRGDGLGGLGFFRCHSCGCGGAGTTHGGGGARLPPPYLACEYDFGEAAESGLRCWIVKGLKWDEMEMVCRGGG